MPKRSLIALVATAVMVGNVRTVIQPGEPLPDDMSEHDKEALLGSAAAADPEVQAGEEEAARKAQLAGLADFQQARDKVIEERKSTAAPGDDDAGPQKAKSGSKAK